MTWGSGIDMQGSEGGLWASGLGVDRCYLRVTISHERDPLHLSSQNGSLLTDTFSMQRCGR